MRIQWARGGSPQHGTPDTGRGHKVRITAGVMAGVVLGGLLSGTSSASTTANGAPSTPHVVGMSSGGCLWLEHHKGQVPLACATSPGDEGTQPDLAPVPGASGGLGAFLRPTPAVAPTRISAPVHFGTNVEATDPREDVAGGQSESAVAVSGNDVVAAWNDLNGVFFDPATPAGSITGVAFSSDGGATFTDVGGPPNNDPCQQLFGDPSVVAYRSPAGATYFYVVSLDLPTGAAGCGANGYFAVSVSVGTVAAGGSTIAFGNPVVVASGGNYVDQYYGGIVNFLDKGFAAIDPARGRIAVSYTCFGISPFRTPVCSPNGDIQVALCDISAQPGTPSCSPGGSTSSYLVVARNPTPSVGELSGAYPTFSARGDLYVAWNQNFISNLPYYGPPSDPFTHQLAARMPVACLTLPTTSCASPNEVSLGSPVKSLDTTVIRGYSRGIGQDFPRVAYDNLTDQLVTVWNEANASPLGDIVMIRSSFDLGTQGPKVKVNDDTGFALHFLPAVSVDASGNINVSWYDRRSSGGTTRTDVYAASIKPGDDGAVNSLVTSVGTDWLATGSLLSPNFGDYTDNASEGQRFFVTWSDGRMATPTTYVASAVTH